MHRRKFGRRRKVSEKIQTKLGTEQKWMDEWEMKRRYDSEVFIRGESEGSMRIGEQDREREYIWVISRKKGEVF